MIHDAVSSPALVTLREPEAAGVFQRFHAGYVGRTGVPVGVFVAVDHLRRTGRLSEEEIIAYAFADAWFQENLPNPPFYDDGNSIGAVTWFRDTTKGMTDRLRPLLSILDSKGVAWQRSVSDDPGRVVYEDRWQIGVIPSSRLGMTPLPYPGVLGPSDWFEVRRGILSGRESPHRDFHPNTPAVHGWGQFGLSMAEVGSHWAAPLQP
jgi:hypothetical protein